MINKKQEKQELTTTIFTTEETENILKGFQQKIEPIIRVRNLKEPIVLLMRRGNKIDVLNGVETNFNFTHTDGTNRRVELTPKFNQRINGTNKENIFILSEDEALPYPQDPMLYSETVKIIFGNALENTKKYELEEIKEKTKAESEKFKNIAMIIGVIIIGAMILLPMIQQTPPTTETITNATNIINNSIGLIPWKH